MDSSTLLALVTVMADIAVGGMAWRLVKALEKNQNAQTEILQKLTERVEKLERGK